MTLAEALRALHEAGRIRSPWLPGMRAILDRGHVGGRTPFRRSDDGLRWLFPSDVELANHIIDRDGEPDVSDHATRGCLVTLAGEAGHPDPVSLFFDAPALTAALIAVAQEVRRG